MEISEELAEIFGIHAGDGYLRNDGKRIELDISGHVEDKEYYDKHISNLFLKEFGIELNCRYFPHRNTYGFVIRRKDVVELLHKFGFPYGRKGNIVKVPESVLNSKDNIIKACFLRGIADTDGSLTFDRKFNGKYTEFRKTRNYYPRIIFTTISKPLSEDVSKMLKYLDFRFYNQLYRPKNPKDSIKYKIWITGVKELEKWMTLVGFANYGKFSKYLIWKKFGHCPPKTTQMQRDSILKGKLDPNSLYGRLAQSG